jgi:transposase
VGDRGLPRHVSRWLEQALLAAGERVVRVAPHRMGASRRGEREPGKSDEIDALAIARAVVKDGIEKFPVAYLDEAAMNIRLLLDHRNDLVAERTRTVNRLRWHLLQLSPELEPSPPRAPRPRRREPLRARHRRPGGGRRLGPAAGDRGRARGLRRDPSTGDVQLAREKLPIRAAERFNLGITLLVSHYAVAENAGEGVGVRATPVET